MEIVKWFKSTLPAFVKAQDFRLSTKKNSNLTLNSRVKPELIKKLHAYPSMDCSLYLSKVGHNLY